MQENMAIHWYASSNSTNFYIMSNQVVTEESFLKLLSYSIDDVSVYTKKPWIFLKFSQSTSEGRTAGWKIHVSATIENYLEIFNIVCGYCIKNKIDFKFLANEKFLKEINSKEVSRLSAGKFIVVYPKESEFRTVIQDISDLTIMYDGPEVLTDYRYSSSKIIYYRYGEIDPIRRINTYGVVETYILDNEANFVKDEKFPYPFTPDWIKKISLEDASNEESLLLKKYIPMQAIKFSSSGGVYEVTEVNSRKIFVMKEARKFTGQDNTKFYSTDRLKREFSFLKLLERTDFVPQVFEIIEEKGNSYLIEEKLEGINLREYIYLHNPLLTNEKDVKKIDDYFKNCLIIFNNIIAGIGKINDFGIYVQDLSETNIIVNFETNEPTVKLIDLEYAILKKELNGITNIQTPGFSYIGEIEGIDIYKGYIIGICMIFPIQNMFEFNRANVFKSIQYLKNIINNKYAQKMLNQIEKYIRSFDGATNICKISPDDVSQQLDQIINCILESYCVLEVDHKKIFFPADPQVYNTNPYSIAHGGLGVLYSLLRISDGKERTILTKIQNISNDIINTTYGALFNDSIDISSGLMIGELSFVYFLMCENKILEAWNVFNRSFQTLKNSDNTGIYYGISGLVILGAYFGFEGCSETMFSELQELLLERRLETDVVGLYEGESGVALIYLVMYMVTNDRRYLDIGESHVANILTYVYENSHGNLTVDRVGKNNSGNKIESPFLYNGLSGIGYMLLYYYKVTKNDEYSNVLNSICLSLDYDIHYFATLMRGLAGITDLLITCLQEGVLCDEVSERTSKVVDQQIKTLNLFEQRDESEILFGFLGEGNLKISHDLHSGSSGIALVLYRYVKYKQSVQTAPSEFALYLLDEIFRKWRTGYEIKTGMENIA
ncbi:class III lanthionine synthetase LanKC N-terminal domain-containing protein [Streptococcus suis]|uniref:class III lanthionine synthetase LanKC N-terminal domain-containing protein n=13 Tax=Streptococcus suis TaxID=1307 RepID=UPI000CF38B80